MMKQEAGSKLRTKTSARLPGPFIGSVFGKEHDLGLPEVLVPELSGTEVGFVAEASDIHPGTDVL